MKKVYSEVWQFFDRLERDNQCVGVLCKLCDTRMKFYGNTTNLRMHVSRKHPIQWEFRNKTPSEEQTLAAVAQPSVLPLSADDDDGGSAKIEMSENDSNVEWLEDDYNQYQTPELPKKRKILRNIKRRPMPRARRISSDLSVSEPSQNFVQTRDEHSIFGDYIANHLRSLKSKRAKANVKQIITTVLWQAEYGAYEDPESVKRMLMQSHFPQQQDTNSTIHSSENNVVDCDGSEENIIS